MPPAPSPEAFAIESTFQMEKYIKTLIENSKAETGYIISKEKIDTKQYIEQICNSIKALAYVKNIEPDISIKSLPKFFTADPNLLQRAVMNIVSNAIEYCPENSKINFISGKKENYIRFSVIDCGKGFSAQDLKQAAKEFYMGDKSRTSQNHYGMGLFITKSIVELHDGIFEITNSQVTGGGQVTIKIPIIE